MGSLFPFNQAAIEESGENQDKIVRQRYQEEAV